MNQDAPSKDAQWLKKLALYGSPAVVGYIVGQISTVAKMDDRWIMIALGILIITIGLVHYQGLLDDLRSERELNHQSNRHMIALVEKNTEALTKLTDSIQRLVSSDTENNTRGIGPHS